MVKILLEEQRSLKDKLAQQENKLNDINEKPPSGPREQLHRKQTAAITKKASERVRSQNPGPKKPAQSADNKNLHAKKMKEQHAIEQAKLEAIENKISRARKKIEEHKSQKSKVAMETRMKFDKAPDQNMDDILYQEERDDIENQLETINEHKHVPLIGGRHKTSHGGASQYNSKP